MKIYSVTDKEFAPYGKVLGGYDTSCLMKALDETTPLPDGVEYVMSEASLESTAIFGQLQNNAYGGMPIQLGWCNGHNTRLNCLEYHRDSELNIGLRDFILLVAKADDIIDGKLETSKVKAFRAAAGQVVEVYETTLHYAPCSTGNAGFRVVIVLPRDTNLPLDAAHEGGEDGHLTAKNKWLIGHAEGGLTEGSHIGLIGKNLNVRD